MKSRNHKCTVTGGFAGFGFDIAVFDRFSDENDAVKYLAFFVDVLSRKLWIYPLLDKIADSTQPGSYNCVAYAT